MIPPHATPTQRELAWRNKQTPVDIGPLLRALGLSVPPTRQSLAGFHAGTKHPISEEIIPLVVWTANECILDRNHAIDSGRSPDEWEDCLPHEEVWMTGNYTSRSIMNCVLELGTFVRVEFLTKGFHPAVHPQWEEGYWTELRQDQVRPKSMRWFYQIPMT